MTSVGQFLVPTPPNPNFCGRERELKSIEDYLALPNHDASSSLSIFAVHGLGGIGYALDMLQIVS